MQTILTYLQALSSYMRTSIRPLQGVGDRKWRRQLRYRPGFILTCIIYLQPCGNLLCLGFYTSSERVSSFWMLMCSIYFELVYQTVRNFESYRWFSTTLRDARLSKSTATGCARPKIILLLDFQTPINCLLEVFASLLWSKFYSTASFLLEFRHLAIENGALGFNWTLKWNLVHCKPRN